MSQDGKVRTFVRRGESEAKFGWGGVLMASWKKRNEE